MVRTLSFAIFAAFLAACSDDGHDQADQEHDSTPASPAADGVQDTIVAGKARDVVCSMIVDAPAKETVVYKNTTYHFCSATCKGKFEDGADQFKTGQPGEKCVCSEGGMSKCRCNHCTKAEKRCPCWDPTP